ncbi:MAG: M56 family metallopeptidase, partial [Planctomycetota bacterium]|nr:M56 family metallopeptidase [Planctomycetota bacterium]
MNVIVDRLIQYVCDYLVLSTIWLALGLLAQRLVRSPALRVACGWCVCAGLVGLFAIAGWADRPQVDWPRIASVPLPLTASVNDPVGPTQSEFEVIDHEVIESVDESVRDSDTAPLLTEAAADEFTAVVKLKGRAVDENPLAAPEQSVVAGVDHALWERPHDIIAAESGVEASTIASGTLNDSNVTVDSTVSPSTSDPSRWEKLGRQLLCVTWLGAAIVALVWLALGSVRTGRLKKNSWPAPEWLNRELTEVIGIERRRPHLAQSAQLDTAVALDAVRPMIVMPSRLVERGSDPALSAMLAHELAHIRQGDLWLLAIQRCLLPLLAAQPLYWWFRRGLSRDQELLADAVAARGREVDYAAALLAWVRSECDRNIPSASWSALAFWPERSLTTRRIEMLLDTNTPVATTASSRSRLGLAVLSTVV